MKKRLKKILGIGILVPILFLVIGLNIKPKCFVFDITDTFSIGNTHDVGFSAHLISPDVNYLTNSYLLNIEYLTPENEYQQFRLDYDYQYDNLNLTTSIGTSTLFNNDNLDNLFIIVSLCNVGQDLIIIDYFLYKNSGDKWILIDDSTFSDYGIGRFYRDDLMLFQYNTSSLNALDQLRPTDFTFWRANPMTYLNDWCFNVNDFLNQAYNEGFNVGHTQGYNEGLDDAGAFADNLWFFTPIISGISSLLAIQIYPNVSIGTFLLIPLALGIIALILVFWRKD